MQQGGEAEDVLAEETGEEEGSIPPLSSKNRA